MSADALRVPQLTLDDLSEKNAPVNIVSGESRYFATLFPLTGKPIDGGYCKPWWFAVVRDLANEHDEHAIAVYALNGEPEDGEIFGRVGFIGRDLAALMAPGLDALAPSGQVAMISVPGLLVGGYAPDRPNIGVYLYLNEEELVESIGLPEGLLDGYSVKV